MTLAVSHNFKPKQVIRSSEVNTDINEIVSYINNLEAAVSGGTAIADGAITTAKLAGSAVTNDKMADNSVDTLEIVDAAVTTAKLDAESVTSAKIAAAVAGNGLAGGAGSALSVNVDDSTIEIDSDSLRVKDSGITEAKLASGVVTKLGQNIGLVGRVSATSSSTSFADLINYTGQGRLMGLAGVNGEWRVTIDGGTAFTISASGGYALVWNDYNQTTPFKEGSDYGDLTELSVHFKTSLLVEFRRTSAGSHTAYGMYERAS